MQHIGSSEARIFHKTYYRPHDFYDSRYDPSFSPALYPGQTVSCRVKASSPGNIESVCLYIKDVNADKIHEGPPVQIGSEWTGLRYAIPVMSGVCIGETGVKITYKDGITASEITLCDFGFAGQAQYTIDFAKERNEFWHGTHVEASQFSYVKGLFRVEDGQLSGSCADFGEAYTGDAAWTDYSFEGTVIPQLGECHGLNFRVGGAIRSYAVMLTPDGKLALRKNANGYRTLGEIDFPWEHGREYRFKITLRGNHIVVRHGDLTLLDYTDADRPYLRGCVGVCVQKGSHAHFKNFTIGE